MNQSWNVLRSAQDAHAREWNVLRSTFRGEASHRKTSNRRAFLHAARIVVASLRGFVAPACGWARVAPGAQWTRMMGPPMMGSPMV